MQLCDKEIYKEMARGELLFVGPDPSFPFKKDLQVQPASVDLRLGAKITRFKDNILTFDTKNLMGASSYYVEKHFNDDEPIEMRPHETIFGEIYEQICIPDHMSGRVRGRNRIARLGISVHCTGDYINPGFVGTMPLQIINHNNFSVILYPYIEICQMVLYYLSDVPLVSYRERLDVASSTYFNGVLSNPPSCDTQATENVIAAYRIRRMVEDYYKQEERAYQEFRSSSQRQLYQIDQKKMISEATDENLKYLFVEGDIYMRDQYNSTQAGIQGPNSGSNATIHQYYGDSAMNESDIQQMLSELEAIKKHLRCNYSDDEHVIVDGNVSTASKLLKEHKISEALSVLKKSGQLLLNIAEKIGCGIVIKYLSSMLNI